MAYTKKTLLDNLCATLDIDIETYQATPQLLNKFVKSGTQIKSLKWAPFRIFKNNDLIDVSDEYLDQVVYSKSKITIESNDVVKTFTNSNGFTVRKLMDHILEIEKEARPKTNWFKGVDAHHIYFEGLHLQSDSSYSVFWGS